MSQFLMPSLGADMESGQLVEWLVKPGDAVHKGDIVAVVETQKGAIDIEIFEEGTVAELCVKEGETVPVGSLLAQIAASGATLTPAVPQAEPAAPAAVPAAPPVQAAAQPVPARPQSGRVKISPAARQL
ncbi:MAG: hypothetical protein RL339_2755, partial [Pseudomonadota bacterium]